MELGDFELRSIITGRYRLDGGAMFGVVPKVLWSKKAPADEQNRISMVMRTVLALDRRRSRVILVDTGAGSKWPPEEGRRFALDVDDQAISSALGGYGLEEADVTDIVLAHLHFDHNGGVTDWAGPAGGAMRLRYPRARHWVHRGHWEHANDPTERDRASFLRRDLAALAEPGVLSFVDGDEPAPPFENVKWNLSHGHTPYQLMPVFQGDGQDLMFVGDLIPTVNHLPLPWVMAYDVRPLVTLEEKRAVFDRCREEGLLLSFPHDVDHGGIAVDFADGKPTVGRRLDL